MAERFYLNSILAPGPVVLEGPEAHHLATVCRLHPGDAVCLFNGDGHEYPARLTRIERRQVTLDVFGVESPRRETGYPIEVAAPLPKGDRAQFLVEKLTELGVTRYVPLTTRHSVVHPREAKVEKLRRYVIEASKQCGRNVLMAIEPLTEWETYSGRRDLPGLRMLAHPENGPGLEGGTDRSAGVALAVGPEGGFTAQEVEQARAAGWQVVHLGPRILRMETAALVLTAWAGSSV